MKRGRDKFKRLKPIIKIISTCLMKLPFGLRIWLFNLFRMKQGNLGLVIRYILIKSISKNVGDNVSIHPGVYIFNMHNLELGNNVSIHPMCYIEAYGGIKIGDDVSIAHAVTILSVTHNYMNTDLPIKDQGISSLRTEIESNVWVGAKATILGGVVIQSGTIIAAGSVVTKNVDENVIVAGVPARKIKQRGINA